MDFGLAYNFRNPEPWKRPFAGFYEDMFEQIAYAEELGFDTVWLPEHHFSPRDGYNPVPVAMAAAVAARTKRIKIGTWVALLPLYHPVRLAEEAALVDLISDGRFMLGVGLGYRKEEYEAFGISRGERGARMEEGLSILRGALSPESFSFDGRFYQVREASVSPQPVQQPLPLWVAARSRLAAERAARHDASLLLVDVGGNAKDTYRAYSDALTARGKNPADYGVHGMVLGSFFISDDPERTREQIRPYIEWEATSMEGWYEEAAESGHDAPLLKSMREADGLGGAPTAEAMVVSDAAQTIRAIEAKLEEAPYTHLVFGGGNTNPSGMPTSEMAPYLERFAREVIPHFQR